MINFAAERIRKYAQVADTQYFKKKAKCSEIGKQILRSAVAAIEGSTYTVYPRNESLF